PLPNEFFEPTLLFLIALPVSQICPVGYMVSHGFGLHFGHVLSKAWPGRIEPANEILHLNPSPDFFILNRILIHQMQGSPRRANNDYLPKKKLSSISKKFQIWFGYVEFQELPHLYLCVYLGKSHPQGQSLLTILRKDLLASPGLLLRIKAVRHHFAIILKLISIKTAE